MITSQDFYEELQEGEEYVSLQIRMSDYLNIPTKLREKAIVTVKQKSCRLLDDPKYCELKSIADKAYKAREIRAFQIVNNKNK
jgi:hypothetical protein